MPLSWGKIPFSPVPSFPVWHRSSMKVWWEFSIEPYRSQKASRSCAAPLALSCLLVSYSPVLSGAAFDLPHWDHLPTFPLCYA